MLGLLCDRLLLPTEDVVVGVLHVVDREVGVVGRGVSKEQQGELGVYG